MNFRCVTVQKSAKRIYAIYPLDQGFGLLIEHDDDTFNSVSLIALDLYGKSIQKFHSIKVRSVFLRILVNYAEPTEFFLQYLSAGAYFVQICKVDKTKIVAGETIQMNIDYDCYYEGRLYGLNLNQFNRQIVVYDMKKKSTDQFIFNMPKGYTFRYVSLFDFWINFDIIF